MSDPIYARLNTKHAGKIAVWPGNKLKHVEIEIWGYEGDPKRDCHEAYLNLPEVNELISALQKWVNGVQDE